MEKKGSRLERASDSLVDVDVPGTRAEFRASTIGQPWWLCNWSVCSFLLCFQFSKGSSNFIEQPNYDTAKCIATSSRSRRLLVVGRAVSVVSVHLYPF